MSIIYQDGTEEQDRDFLIPQEADVYQIVERAFMPFRSVKKEWSTPKRFVAPATTFPTRTVAPFATESIFNRQPHLPPLAGRIILPQQDADSGEITTGFSGWYGTDQELRSLDIPFFGDAAPPQNGGIDLWKWAQQMVDAGKEPQADTTVDVTAKDPSKDFFNQKNLPWIVLAGVGLLLLLTSDSKSSGVVVVK
jgi:hypothetical protein